MVFGGFSEWFSYTDGRSHPSIVPEEWAHLTRSIGFSDFQYSTEIGGGREVLFTTQKPHIGEPLFGITSSDHHFLTYTFGKEIELQEEIKGFSVDQDISLWILATNGVDGDAAQGLVKGLSREYINWDIHLGIFDDGFDEASRVDWILTYGDCLARDTIVHFGKDGVAYVPRVMPSAPPSSFNPGNTSLDLVRNHLPPLGDQQLLIDVRCWSDSVSSYRGFAGTIVQSKYFAFKQGQRVVGLALNHEVSDKIICSPGSVMILDDDDDSEILTEYALTSAITTLILGPARTIYGTSEKPPLKVLLADEEAVTSRMQKFCCTITCVVEIRTNTVNDDEKFDIILTSSKQLAERPEIRLWRGRILVWDNVLRELTSGDSWILGHLIKTSLRLNKVDRSISESPVITPGMQARLVVTVSPGQKSANLFNPSKVYLLVGGVSDLGVHFALWMYQRGAKRIVLTSRRGRKFLDTDALEVTRLKIEYLQCRDDLSIQVEACDATSIVATQKLIDGIKEPLGGCFLMPLVLSDGLFANQTRDSIHRVVSPKWDSLKVLDVIVPIQTLDFCVSFSTITTLFGLAGQSNYIMANTIVDGKLARHQNAFSMCVPSILDLGSFARYPDAHRGILGLAKVSPDDLCAYFEDGLLKLYSGVRAPYYIPEMPWNGVHKVAGLTSDTHHLATRKEAAIAGPRGDESTVLDKVLNLLDLSMSDFSPEVPFTSYGMDSLAATRVSEALRPYVKVSQMQLLGGMTWNHLEAKVQENGSVMDPPTTNPAEPLLKMVEKYSKNFENHFSTSEPPKEDVIVITGTTGSLGSNTLVECLKAPNVRHIYALNRPSPDPVKAQKEAFASRGFDPSLVDTTKLTLLNAELATDDLGIGELLLDELRTTVTHIIHVGWIVKWSLGLPQFEPLIRGTRNLIDLALSSPLPTPPRVVFISTVTVLRGLAESGGLCPEEFVGPDLALGSGYTESKWVAERLLELAAAQTSLRPIIVRVDQVSGSGNGQWNTAEWIPSLVQSATATRSLPDSPSFATWLPPQVVGSAIVEIRNTSSSVIHITHPKPVSWRYIFQRVAHTLGVPIVPFQHWLAQLEALATSPEGKEIKAVALLSTFRTIDLSAAGFLPRMSNENALRESPTLAAAQPLTEKDVDSWLSYWKSISFISF